MQDSGLHVSCFYTAQNDYTGPLLLHWAWNVGNNSYPSYHCEPLSDAFESWSRCVLKLDVTSGHFIDVDMGMSQNLQYHALGDEHPLTSYFDVHQGAMVLIHGHWDLIFVFRPWSPNASCLIQKLPQTLYDDPLELTISRFECIHGAMSCGCHQQRWQESGTGANDCKKHDRSHGGVSSGS